MQSILEAFAYGYISPLTRMFKSDSQYGRTMEELTVYEEKLLRALNEKDKGLFEKYRESETEVSLLTGIDNFICGYRLGVLMTTEVFNGKNDLVIAADKRKDG